MSPSSRRANPRDDVSAFLPLQYLSTQIRLFEIIYLSPTDTSKTVIKRDDKTAILHPLRKKKNKKRTNTVKEYRLGFISHVFITRDPNPLRCQWLIENEKEMWGAMKEDDGRFQRGACINENAGAYIRDDDVSTKR